MNVRVEKTGEIPVVDESGNKLTIDVLTRQTLFKRVGGPSTWIKGATHYELNGEHCNQIDSETWKTLMTEKILRRA